MAEAAPSLAWAVPAVVRALRVGHRAHRAGLLRLLAAQDDATLSDEPARAALEEFLRGDDRELVRAVGALVAARGLAAYAPVLLELLGRPDRAADAERWLRRGRLARPTRELVRLAVDPKASLDARAAALRLLEGVQLSTTERALLVTTLAHRPLHGPALRLLEPGATEELVVAAVAANMAYGRLLARKRREERTGSSEPSWFQRLLSRVVPDHDPLGVHHRFRAEQQDFVRGIARLAIAARSERFLLELLDHLFDPEVGAALEQAYVEQDLERVAGPLLSWVNRELRSGEAWTARRRARALRVLGALARAEALPEVARSLPDVGSPAGEDQKAAIVAMARLLARTGQALSPRSQLDLLLAGAVAFVRRALGQPPGGAPGHPSVVAACLEAGAHLKDARVAQVALDLLQATVDVPEVGDALAPALAALAPLELEPALERVLAAPDARPRARVAAVDVVERLGLARLAPRVVEAAAREPAVADRAARALAALAPGLAPDDVRRHVEALARAPGASDQALDALLEAATRVLDPGASRALARAALAAGGGGRRTRRRALELARQDPDRRALLELTLRLLDSPHGDARTAALELAIEQGLLRGGPADDPALEPAWSLVPRLLARALERHDAEGWARKQVRLALDALVPRAGTAHVPRAEAEDLRERLRQAGAWVQPATFHAAHRRLLELAARGAEVGALHGAVLALLAGRSVQHPKTGARGPYEGPLPRLAAARAHPSPFVQEALWDVVAAPGYRRTLRLVLAFLDSPRPRVRAAALGLVPRDGALAHDALVLARLDDPAPEVRAAAVELLGRHELARFASALRLRLADPVERVRLAAARTLARWGDREGLEAVVRFLESPDDALRREAVEHLRRVEPAQLVGLLAPFVTLERPRAAAAALAALRADRGLPDDPALRAAVFAVAAQGRGPLRAAALALLPLVVDAPRLAEVVPLLGDADPHVRAAAAHVLRTHDGRPHAPAVARLAAESPSPGVRREALALLADLDVPEAARGLLPLLLDPDPQVRALAHALAGRLRGPSLLPDLEALLRLGLERAAPPEAIRDLVRLLDRTAGEDAAPALAEALRCEERGVWEAVLEAARARGTDAHMGAVVRLLGASPPPPPALLALALGEVARLGRRDALDGVRRIVKEATNEAARRKALEALAALDPDAGRQAALAEARAAEERLAELERRPEAKDRKRDQALRLERARVLGTVSAAGRVALEAARGRRGFDEVAPALPARAWSRTTQGLALELATRAVLEEGTYVSDAALSAARHERTWEQVAWRLRDRLAPGAWLERLEDLTRPGKHRPALDAARLLARARAGAPLEAKELVKRVEDAAASGGRVDREEDLALGVAAAWRPELVPGLFDRLLEAAIARQSKRLDGAWALGPFVERWGGKKLALGVREGTARLAALGARAGVDVLARLFAAEGDVARLAAEIERRPLADRARLVTLLGEVGTPEAIEALGRLGGPDAPVKLREVCARAAALAGPGVEPLVARWLQDGHPEVLVAALAAVERLGLAGQADAVLRLLGHAHPAVQAAAAGAAGALRLARARDLLLALLRGPATEAGGAAVVLEDPGEQPVAPVKALCELLGISVASARALMVPGTVLRSGLAQAEADAMRRALEGAGARVAVRSTTGSRPAGDAVREAAARALERLPQAELVGADPTPLVETLRTRPEADPLVDRVSRVLARVVGTDQLDTTVGPLLGEPGAGAAVGALRVLARREHRAAASAVRALLAEAPAWAVRAAAADAAAELGDEEALPALRAALARESSEPVRAAALRAAARLLRRQGDGEGAARLALEHVRHEARDVARAAADELAHHPAPDACHEEVVRGLVAALLDHVAPGAPTPEVDEPARALAARCRGRLRAEVEPERVVPLVAALAAQGDVARTEQVGRLLLLLIPDVHAEALAGVAPCLEAAPGVPWREELLPLLGGQSVRERVWAHAVELLARVDPVAAATRALEKLNDPRATSVRPRLLRVVLRARQQGDPGGALAAGLRRALLSGRDEERRLARAGLEPGRAGALSRDEEEDA